MGDDYTPDPAIEPWLRLALIRQECFRVMINWRRNAKIEDV